MFNRCMGIGQVNSTNQTEQIEMLPYKYDVPSILSLAICPRSRNLAAMHWVGVSIF